MPGMFEVGKELELWELYSNPATITLWLYDLSQTVFFTQSLFSHEIGPNLVGLL